MSTLNVTTIIPTVGTNTSLSLDGKDAGKVVIVDDASIGGDIAVTGASTLAALTASGTPTFSSTNNMSVGGNLLLTTASKGIYLGVTTATAANLLDDYEEGTWTPAFTSTNATFAYTYQLGSYTKVGTLIHCEFRLELSGSPGGTTSNGTLISGLPFTAATLTNLYYGFHIGHFFNINLDSNEQAGIAGQLGSQGTTIELKGLGDNVGEQGITAAQMGSAAEIRGSFSYRTA